jgi:FkbM family methyltransferase
MMKEQYRELLRSTIRKLPRPVERGVRRALADRYSRRYFWAGGNYRWIFPILREKISSVDVSEEVIVEIGSRDCLDAIELANTFLPKHVYAFEACRSGVRRCLDVLAEHPKASPTITLCGFALGERSGLADFYEYVLKDVTYGNVNIGLSSMYSWTSDFHHPDCPDKSIEKNEKVEERYSVPVFRADDLNFLQNDQVFLIAMDVEGAELAVLKGAVKVLERTRFLCCEAGYNLPRIGHSGDANAIVRFLDELGWKLVSCSNTGSDTLPDDEGYAQMFNLLFRNDREPSSALSDSVVGR